MNIISKTNKESTTATILSIAAVVGVIATSAAAGYAGSLTADKLHRAEEKKGEPLNKTEKIVNTTLLYVPSILIGTGTVICILGSNILNKRAQASIASAYMLLEQSFKEYRSKLIELKGEETDQEVRLSLVRERCDYHCLADSGPDKKVTWHDPISDRYFERYEREIMDAEYHMNRNFIMSGCASLNDFYEFLGIEKTEKGDELGWSIDSGIYWVDFEHRLNKDGSYEIEFIFGPDDDFMEGLEV